VLRRNQKAQQIREVFLSVFFLLFLSFFLSAFFFFSSLLFFHFLIFVFVCDLNTMITRRGNKRVGGGSPFPLPQDPARPPVRCIVNVTEKVETD